MATTTSKPKSKTKAKGVASARRATKSAPPSTKRPARNWSQRVTKHSYAMDLQRNVFALDDPKMIAASLKQSAERSKRLKSTPYGSAMSMLTFYINRAGKNLPDERRDILERAKQELRIAFGRQS